MRTFVLVLSDLRSRDYRITFERKAKGQFPRVARVERKHIVFVPNESGKMVKSWVWSQYRESCHGALNAHIKMAITQASATIASAE